MMIERYKQLENGRIIFLTVVLFFGIMFPAIAQNSESDQVLTSIYQDGQNFYEARVSIQVEEATIPEIFELLESQMGLRFLYKKDVIENSSHHLNLEFPMATAAEVLMKVSEETGLRFRQINRIISVGVNELREPVVNEEIQEETVSGRVVDAQTGESLPGVNILIEGTDIGTATGPDGTFQLEAPSLQETLIITYIGYQRLELPMEGRSEFDIELLEEEIGLEEVVVIGYGEQRRSELTGSISSISSQEITAQPTYNMEQALQGLAAGVRVEADGYRPGQGATIRVRGIRSFVASNDPLIVMDGVPIEGGLQDFNTRNIASIEILKDASATAIYGSRGANGVVLITTQRGYEGRTTVEYSGFAGIQTVANKVDMMSGERYAEMKREAHKVQGTYTGNDEDMFEGFELRGLEQGISTEWQDLVWQRGFQQDHQLRVSGGDERTRYFLSGGFQDHLAIAPNNDYARYSGQINLDHQVTDWLRLDLSTQISRSIRHEAGSMSRTVRINPLAVPHDEDGNLVPFPAGDIFQENPLFDYDRSNYEDRRERTRILSSLVANVNISENFVYRMTFSPDWTFRNEGRFRGSNTVARQFGTSDARVQNEDISNYLFDNLVEFNQTIAERHSLSGTLLYSLQSFNSDFRSIQVEDLPYESQRFYNIGTGEQVDNRSSRLEEWLLESTMGRVNYNFDERYMLTLTGRVDGSTRFAEGNKYGFFPSVAFAWNISNESFMQAQQIFDLLRVRLSYGKSGNTGITPYQSQGGLSRVPYSFGNQGEFGFEHDAIANPDLRWESTTQLNLGVELGILDNRLNVDLNVYRANTDDLLMQRALPTTSGFSSVVENVGGTRNTGLEITVSSENIRSDRFLWTTNLNFSTNRNEITELFGGQEDDPGNQWFIGHPIDVHFEWKFDGIWQLDEADQAAVYNQTPGEMRVVDVTGDGQYTADDRMILGSPFPKWEAGLTNRIAFRDFDFSANIYAVQGVMISSGAYDSDMVPLRARYNSREVNFWTEDNPSNEWPQPRFEREFPRMTIKSFVSGDYIRIRNMTLGYQLPASLAESLNMLRARVYVSAQNPFTFTDFEGFDPEAARSNSFPNARTLMLGVDLTF